MSDTLTSLNASRTCVTRRDSTNKGKHQQEEVGQRPRLASTMAPSAADEAAFMSQLMQGLDDSFWNAVPSPDPTPIKNQRLPSQPTPQILPSIPLTPTKRPASFLKPSASTSSLTQQEYDISAFLEGSENWDLDADPFSPIKPSVKIPVSPPYVPEICTRCVVETVVDECAEDGWRKAIVARVEPGSERVDIHLYHDWYQTDIRIDDVLNVLGAFANPGPSTSSSLSKRFISITTQSNLLILHPDVLLTATALSNAPQCRRKPLLTAMVRSTSDITPALIWGSMLHEVMQRCLQEERWGQNEIDGFIEEAVSGGLAELVKLGISEEVATREMKERSKGLSIFKDRFLGDVPKADAILTNTRSAAYDSPSLLAISKLLDIEEDVWSPTYGIKGKIDATVLGVISDPMASTAPSTTGYIKAPASTQRSTKIAPLPLELKTGRALLGMEHRAQTMLYTLLLSERYGVDVQEGLLYYTQSEGAEVVRVPRVRNEVRGLVGLRNELAGWMWRRVRKEKKKELTDEEPGSEEPFLPAPIDDERVCKRCYALDTCLLFRKTHSAAHHDPPVPSFLQPIFEIKTGHLSVGQTEFFRKWERLLSLEERDLVRFKRELWTMGAAERERRGRCFGEMVLSAVQGDGMKDGMKEEGKGQKIHRYTYRFPTQTQTFSSSLLNGHLSTGDAITVSVEPHLLALARGFIVDLTPDEVVLGVDHVLDLDGIKARLARGLASESGDVFGAEDEVIFRIDKDELFGGMARVRNNLAQLFYADGDRRRLELVVDLRKPVFSPIPDAPSPDVATTAATLNPHLNASQQHAISHVLAAQDYALILGMPGTGKTTVIAELIRTLVGQSKTVLVCSYTHSAVDTVLMKLASGSGCGSGGGGKDLLGGEFGILRLGNADKVHPGVRMFMLDTRRKARTVEELERQLMSPMVVATTCLTRKGGLDISLFRRLSDAHPHAVVDLRFQYRMNADIMMLSNKLIYGDRLRCGDEVVAQRCLELGDRAFLGRLHPGGGASQEKNGTRCKETGECWLEKVIDESCKAVFIDTDALPARDSRVGDLVQNTTEAELVRQLTLSLLACGVNEEQIGIISLYRQQVKLLEHMFQDKKGIEILTADRSQGRDKDCVIVSLVRSNEDGFIGDLVKDWRRMNVSFTRARAKLVIFGSRKTLQQEPLLAQFFELMEGQGWLLQLKKGAVAAHESVFEVCETPKKRTLRGDEQSEVKEEMGEERPVKKMKMKAGIVKDVGLLRGRPILRDLVGNDS
ncbi:AAA domain-containing protein [Crassisporium funariophilum]|nr:AAA domain-containing protein [Crassisporium funariophilum]